MCICTFLAAQGNKEYWVYSVTGKVIADNQPVKAKQLLSTDQTIFIPDNAQLTLLNEKGKRLYSFHKPGQMKLKAMIEDTGLSVTKLTGNYLQYIKDQLFAKKEQDNRLGKTRTGGRRGEEEDSLFVASLAKRLNLPTGVSAQYALKEMSSPIQSDFSISLQLVSLSDGTLLNNRSYKSNPYALYIVNNDETLLFVNVLHIDNEGVCSLVLQPDKETGFMNYLVPPGTSILFSDNSFVMTGIDSDSFILLATPFPVNFNALLKPIYGMGASKGKFPIGVDREDVGGKW